MVGAFLLFGIMVPRAFSKLQNVLAYDRMLKLEKRERITPSETLIRKEKYDASTIFCNVDDFHRLCIFSAKQISKAYISVLSAYDGCGCHRKSGLSANSRSQD